MRCVRLCFQLTLIACSLNAVFSQQTIEALLKKLKDPSASVRSAAVQKITESWQFDIDAFRPLVAALSDTDPAVRKYAAIALRDIRNPRAVPALLKLLNDPNANIRAAAIDTLQETADPRALNSLIVVWQTDKEERLRDAAFTAIRFIGNMRTTDALLAALKDPAKSRQAINALGSFGGDQAYEALAAISVETDNPNRMDALIALASMGNPQAADLLLPLLPNDMLAHFIAQLHDPRVAPYLLEEFDSQPWSAGALGELRNEQAVERLIKMVGDTAVERSRRMSAIEALGKIRDPQAVPALIGAIKDKEGSFLSPCQFAVKALGSIGDAKAVPALLPLLKGNDSSIRTETVRALRYIRSPQSIDGLLALTKSDDDFLKNDAYYALACIPDARAVKSVINMLLSLNENLGGSEWDEEDFFNALGTNPSMSIDQYLTVLRKTDCMGIFRSLACSSFRDPLLLDAMIDWMKRNGRSYTSDDSVAQALAQYGEKANDALLAEFNNPESSSYMIIVMLGKLGEKRAIPRLMEIVENTNNSESILALATLGAKDITPKLLEIARSDDPDMIFEREAAYNALGLLKEPRAFDILIAALKKDGRAAYGLGKLGDVRAIEPLITVLKDDHQHAYTAAAWAILQLPPDERTIEPLLDIFHHSFNSDVQARIDAAEALARFTDERILFDFCQVLKRDTGNSREPLRRRLARLLGERKDKRAVRTLMGCLSYSSDPGVAVEAAKALEKIGDKRAVLSLIAVVNDRDPGLRQAALASLKTLTGQDFGSDHARWVSWWLSTKEK